MKIYMVEEEPNNMKRIEEYFTGKK